jgi:two-component system chemotaxis response regulator CheY
MLPSATMANILIVDDSAIVRTQVRQCLEAAGYEITEAVDGQAGLTTASERAYDLVVTDLHMPGMDGLSLAEALRERDDYEKTPIFVLTTETDSDIIARGREIGVTAWVTKPVQPDILLNGVRLVLPA